MKTQKHPFSRMTGFFLASLLAVFTLISCNQQAKKQDTQQKTEAQTEQATTAKEKTPANGAVATIQGEVLDMSCYMTKGAKGQGHKMCAQGCLDKGLPAGILSKADGQVYLLVEDHKKSDAYKKVLKHAADNITITGKVINKNGVQSLVVEKVELEG